MKNLKLLTALFAFILLAACSEDKLPTEPNLPETDKLNSRSAELYGGGVDAVEAARIIKAEFSFDDNILLKSLYDAGYSAGDITRAIHIAYDYNPRLAETVLVGILTNKTISDVTELILTEYKSELKLKPTDLKYFIRNVDTIERRVIILKESFEKSPAETLELLKFPGKI